MMRERGTLPPASSPPKAPLPDPPATPSLPFFEKFKKEHAVEINEAEAEETKEITTITEKKKPELEEPPLSPMGSESSYGGLAYADSSDGEDDDATSHAGTVQQDSAPSSSTTPGKNGAKVRFPSMASDSRYSSASESDSASTAAASPKLLLRSLSQSTTYTVRSTAKSTGALDRAMETLFEEEPASPTAAVPSVSFALEGQRDSMRPKLPTRAHTTPGLSEARASAIAAGSGTGNSGKKRASARKEKVRTCLKCEKTIEDGRWIQMEGGGVMCDRCWKNMYLPKVRGLALRFWLV